MNNTLFLKGISKSFKDLDIFENVDISFSGGKIYGLVGANGSGKSVLLKIIAGLMTPDKGNIYFNETKLTRDNFYQINIGASIEKPTFINDLSGFDNLKYLASFRKKITENEILFWMKTFGLYDVRAKKVGKYSLGMKQKLSIIQAIMEKQNIILLDEVSNSLDQDSKVVLKKVISELRDEGHIIIYVNHNIHEVYDYADEVYKIENKGLMLC